MQLMRGFQGCSVRQKISILDTNKKGFFFSSYTPSFFCLEMKWYQQSPSDKDPECLPTESEYAGKSEPFLSDTVCVVFVPTCQATMSLISHPGLDQLC